MDAAERMASAVSDVWADAQSEYTWFQIRSWLHGASIVTDDYEQKEGLCLLRDLAAAHQWEAQK